MYFKEFIIIFLSLNVIYGSLGGLLDFLKVDTTKYINRVLISIYEYILVMIGYVFILNQTVDNIDYFIAIFLAMLRVSNDLESKFTRQGRALMNLIDIVFCLILVIPGV